jgi:nitrogen fixation NifU-like protein
MSDLRELYQEVILDHGRRPRNFHPMDEASHSADGFNPLCGDRVKIFVRLEDGVVRDLSFQGSGCAISTASASMLTEAIRGRTLAEAKGIFQSFHRMLTSAPGPGPDSATLGKLAVFSGVSEFPNRVKCATLAWHTLQAALEGENGASVSTE